MANYITGDIHGDFSGVTAFCKERQTTKEDVIITLGESGLNYYLDYRDKKVKEGLRETPITLFCVRGNHEKYAGALESYKEIEFKGGMVYQEDAYPNILFGKDGETYLFETETGLRKTLIIGGAYSVDKPYRLKRGFTWFADEQPSEELKREIDKRLETAAESIDMVFSHTCPRMYEPIEWFMSGLDQSTVDKSTEDWLDTVYSKLPNLHKWYCGHYHGEKKVGKLEFMFTTIKEL